LRATRRRRRTLDPLATPEAVRAVCQLLRERMPNTIPSSEKHLMRFLFAVRHVERRPASDTKRGRPSRWPREKLTEAASLLRGILERETSGRVSVSSFIGQYLPILQFPSDVAEALSSGRINLQEAAQLARLSAERLGCAPAAAKARRLELINQHASVQGSQSRLRARVKEILGEIEEQEVSSEGMASVVGKVDEMLEVDPSDARHMFWEEMKRLFYAMREIEPEDLDEETMDDFLAAIDGVSNVLFRVERKRQERHKQRATDKMPI
jgi:hypothetical protein